MKIDQFLVITNVKAFLGGDYSSCFSLYDHKATVKDWVTCGQITIDVDPEAINEDEALNAHIQARLAQKVNLQRQIADIDEDVEATRKEILALDGEPEEEHDKETLDEIEAEELKVFNRTMA